jgi:thymidylate synthase (FAD)
MIEQVWSTPKGDPLIAYMARVSAPPEERNRPAARLIRYCIAHGHWSVFEMVSMCVEVHTSRAISAQMIRHRSFSYQEFSQRYSAVDPSGLVLYAARRQDNKNRQNSIDDLPLAVKVEWEDRQRDNWRRAFEHYQWALDNDIARECARMVLPLQTSTRMFMVGSVRSWIHYLAVRTDASAQKEHRDLAIPIQAIFCETFPQVAAALAWGPL